jgi:hypothetical protein
MQYIDKNKAEFKDRAYRLLNTFIQGQWQEDAGRYINLTYESFRNDAFRDLLLEEQSHYCCYCMKYILGKDTTLEHIIPNKATESTVMDDYRSYGEIAENVFFWEKELDSKRLDTPPFPHILAYENLVASCNGDIPDGGLHQCCNYIRGQKEIIPVFYIQDIEKEFEYDLNGMIICDERYHPTIAVLNLEHPTLQLFRRCWLNLPDQYTVQNVIEAGVDEDLRMNIIDDMDRDRINLSDRTTLQNSDYWKTFMNFFWFRSRVLKNT